MVYQNKWKCLKTKNRQVSQKEILENNEFFKEKAFFHWLNISMLVPLEFQIPAVSLGDQHAFFALYNNYLEIVLVLYNLIFNKGADEKIVLREIQERVSIMAWDKAKFDSTLSLFEKKYGVRHSVERETKDEKDEKIIFDHLSYINISIRFYLPSWKNRVTPEYLTEWQTFIDQTPEFKDAFDYFQRQIELLIVSSETDVGF